MAPWNKETRAALQNPERRPPCLRDPIPPTNPKDWNTAVKLRGRKWSHEVSVELFNSVAILLTMQRQQPFHQNEAKTPKLLADVHFWKFRGREVLVYSILPSNQLETCMKRPGWELHGTLTDRTWLDSSLSNFERKVQLYSWGMQKLHGPVVLSMCSIHGGQDGS